MTARGTLRPVVFKVIVASMLMLATIGGWEVYKATMGMTDEARASAVFDHFNCYDLVPVGPPVRQAVTVTDQFHPQGLQVTVMGAHLLCTPAAKSVP